METGLDVKGVNQLWSYKEVLKRKRWNPSFRELIVYCHSSYCTIFHMVKCCLISFITIVRPSLAHWVWLWIVPFTWSGIRAYGGCERSTGDDYSSSAPEACSAERTLAIVRMRSLLSYSEHCRLAASAREQSRVLALLNRPLITHLVYVGLRVSTIMWFVFPTGFMKLMIVCYITYFLFI
jgi:hypothetical protein